ncbi:transcriptional regulator [Bifidobacterium magnum]|uniref:Transcriptional regulator n=1 Tax=Bifidobacterium magnum TaxID=1692 RepID=A0A087B821_9BIFI|nr:transcriptional regulator [Bifidobacterium magnum]
MARCSLTARFAVAVFNVVVTVDPQAVLIGGSVSCEPALIPMIEDELNKNENWKDFKTDIKRCRYSANAGLIGAYYAWTTEAVAR